MLAHRQQRQTHHRVLNLQQDRNVAGMIELLAAGTIELLVVDMIE